MSLELIGVAMLGRQDLVPLFDRCCHLVLDEADTLVKEHAVHLKNIFGQYQQAVQRTKKTDANGQKYFVPRQVGRS